MENLQMIASFALMVGVLVAVFAGMLYRPWIYRLAAVVAVAGMTVNLTIEHGAAGFLASFVTVLVIIPAVVWIGAQFFLWIAQRRVRREFPELLSFRSRLVSLRDIYRTMWLA